MKIIDISEGNIEKYDHCLIKNSKSPGYIAKTNWIKSQFKNGLVIKRAVTDNDETIGFIEYIDIENAWRAVKGKNYLFIHCIFTYPKKHQGNGVARALIEDCIKDAKRRQKDGIAVITSKKSFMSDNRIFLKSKFKEVDSSNDHELLELAFCPTATKPEVNDIEKKLKKYNGIHLFYSDQCPSLAKPVHEIIAECKNSNIKINVHYIKTARQAQNTPFISGTFGVVIDGKICAERCVSLTRFLNIVKKRNR